MLKVKSFLRRILTRWGYILSRLESAIPPGIAEYLRSLCSRTASPISVICFDHEVRMQYEILAAIPKERVTFVSPVLASESRKMASGATVPPAPREPFVAVIDVGVSPIEPLFAELPWLGRADVILLRQQIGLFSSGGCDLRSLSVEMEKFHYKFMDVIDVSLAPLLESASSRPTFVYERKDMAELRSRLQRYRTNEAMTCLSAPIATRRDFRLLAGRGSFGYAAGVLNPGAMLAGDRMFLLCRTEHTPWGVLKSDGARFFAPSLPVLLELDNDGGVHRATEVTLERPSGPGNRRIEDFRMFRFRDETFSNHAVISSTRDGRGHSGALRLDATQTRVGISKLDIGDSRLAWCGFPTVDRPLAKTEKNWAMFTDGDRVFLLYSFSPYVLLCSNDWPGLKFSTIREKALALDIEGDGVPLRNSINPVDYDANHWLHIVHKVHPDKRYSFWAVLIGKQTLLPVKMSDRPLLVGGSSAPASIIYACSAICRSDDVFLFAGIDDCATGTWCITRSALDRHWLPIDSFSPC